MIKLPIPTEVMIKLAFATDEELADYREASERLTELIKGEIQRRDEAPIKDVLY